MKIALLLKDRVCFFSKYQFIWLCSIYPLNVIDDWYVAWNHKRLELSKEVIRPGVIPTWVILIPDLVYSDASIPFRFRLQIGGLNSEIVSFSGNS